MATPAVLERMRRIGMGVLAPEQGLACLQELLRRPNIDNPVTAISPFAWPRLLSHLGGMPEWLGAFAEPMPEGRPVEVAGRQGSGVGMLADDAQSSRPGVAPADMQR